MLLGNGNPDPDLGMGRYLPDDRQSCKREPLRKLNGGTNELSEFSAWDGIIERFPELVTILPFPFVEISGYYDL
jgi:hypothetical protein